MSIVHDLTAATIENDNLSVGKVPDVLEISPTDCDSISQESEEKKATFRLIDTVISYITILPALPREVLR